MNIQEKDRPNGPTGDLKREAAADLKARTEIIKEIANSAKRIRKSIADNALIVVSVNNLSSCEIHLTTGHKYCHKSQTCYMLLLSCTEKVTECTQRS